jgi:LysR family transcriptional regulator, cell division regulator
VLIKFLKALIRDNKLYLPSFHDLNYFKLVAEYKSFSAAAKKIGVSQPSLSIALKRLEESVELNLFVRNKKGVELTRDGQSFLVQVRHLLDHWQEIHSGLVDKKKSLKGNFRFGVHQSIAQYALGEMTIKLIKKFPELEIEFVHDHSQNINQMIIDCKLDFAIVVNPLRHPDLTLIKLFEDQFFFWKSRKSTAFNNIKNDELVLICDKDLAQTKELLSNKKLESVKVKRYIYSNNLEVVGELTSQGSGIGVLPERVCSKHFKKLERLSLFPEFTDEMYFVFRRDFIHSPAFSKLKDFFIEQLSE